MNKKGEKMKKILLVLVIALTLVLSGCERTNDFVDNYNSSTNPYYTQEEIDEMFRQEGVDGANDDLYVMALIIDDFYTKDELDEGFEDVRLYLEDLQAQIADLQAQIDELNE